MWIRNTKIYYKVELMGLLVFRYYYYDPVKKRFIYLGVHHCFTRRRKGYKKGMPKIYYRKQIPTYIPLMEKPEITNFFIGNILI